MSKYNTDISPAILELKKLHNLLLDRLEQRKDMNAQGLQGARETVISILPGERRREDGWYKWRMWEKKSDGILHELDSSHKEAKYHEIYVSGESLSGTTEEIVLLMMHQVAHQAASIQSVQSYHSEWIRVWLDRLFEIPAEAIERDEVLGWYKIDQAKLGKAAPLVASLASRLAPHHFDLFRAKLKRPTYTGKMYKWTCECGKPVVRTGGILYATCQNCQSWFKLHITNDVRSDFARRVPEDRKWL